MSAEDVVAVVRVHADRVHDAVRRLGCEPGVAAEVVDAGALELVDAIAERPETVVDAVGWWFARSREIAGRVATSARDLPLGRGVLSADDDQIVLAEALEELPERERFALLLRDAYDLPTSTVAAALGTDRDDALRVVGRARRAVVPLLDDEPGPAVPAHAPDLASLARLGEGGVLAARDATTHRHVLSCAGCRSVVESQQRVHLLLSGLTVVALGADDRVDLLSRTEAQARALLPSAASLVPDDDEELLELEDDERPVLPAWLAAVAVLVAVVLGTGIGVLLSRGPEAVLPIADDVLPTVTIEPVATPTPIHLTAVPPAPPPPPAPETSVFTIRPRTTAPVAPEPQPTTAAPTPTPTPTTSPTEAAEATISVQPGSGRNGERLEVTGRGWTPGSRVVLTYLDPLGRDTGSRTSVRVNDNGRFVAELRARDPENVPGRHSVQATDGTTTSTAPFDVRP